MRVFVIIDFILVGFLISFTIFTKVFNHFKEKKSAEELKKEFKEEVVDVQIKE